MNSGIGCSHAHRKFDGNYNVCKARRWLNAFIPLGAVKFRRLERVQLTMAAGSYRGSDNLIEFPKRLANIVLHTQVN